MEARPIAFTSPGRRGRPISAGTAQAAPDTAPRCAPRAAGGRSAGTLIWCKDVRAGETTQSLWLSAATARPRAGWEAALAARNGRGPVINPAGESDAIAREL
jgi:hypothetical protein